MSRRLFAVVVACLTIVPGLAVAQPAELARGTIVDDVACASDATQRYALYLPKVYTPDRTWSVLMGFHASGRGRAIVETYRAVAERYGYIVAASNNSRNGPWDVSAAAVRAMSGDLARRFSIDAERVYLTGMSGGARVAMQVALGSKAIAGVIASSAGFPDARPRDAVPFAVFGTVGTEDFNYLEMRRLDRQLASPHRLAVFDGGHTLPPAETAAEALEWMELRAMQEKRRARDDALLDRLLEARRQRIGASGEPLARLHLLEAVVGDFSGLRDVAAEAAEVARLKAQPEVDQGLAREQADETAEEAELDAYLDLEAGLVEPARRSSNLLLLRERLARWAKESDVGSASPERSRARRLLRAATTGAAGRVRDSEYRALVEQYARR